jgi:soluble P-type ATPase
MIEIKIPGYKTLQLKHLVLDHNGTLAVDGILVAGVKESLDRLSADMEIHVLTADTFGKARSQMTRTPANWRTLKSWAVSIQSASETGAMID